MTEQEMKQQMEDEMARKEEIVAQVRTETPSVHWPNVRQEPLFYGIPNSDCWERCPGWLANVVEAPDGDIAVAKPGYVHGILNSGVDDMIVYSILSPLPVEIDPVPDFEYPE